MCSSRRKRDAPLVLLCGRDLEMKPVVYFVGALVCVTLAVTTPYSGQSTFAWAMAGFLAGGIMGHLLA